MQTLSPGAPCELLPFDEQQGIQLIARAERRPGLLRIEYRLGGENAEDIAFPASGTPRREDGLWEHTCFEAFIAESAQPWYWEVNLSPSLAWQIYHFRGYRSGRKPEGRISIVQGEILPENSAGRGFLMTLDTSALFTNRVGIDLGVSVVLEAKGRPVAKAKSYWALSHPGKEPDFHLRKSFALHLG